MIISFTSNKLINHEVPTTNRIQRLIIQKQKTKNKKRIQGLVFLTSRGQKRLTRGAKSKG